MRNGDDKIGNFTKRSSWAVEEDSMHRPPVV